MSTISSKLRLSPTKGPLGVIAEGIDARQPQLPADTLALKRALLEHHILIFRGQDLSEPEFKDFASYFGAIFAAPQDVPVLASTPAGATPEIVLISNVDNGYTGTGELSPHSDHHWTPYPSSGSLLYALEVPTRGGETSFYNMNLAYETLDLELKRAIRELRLITYNPFLVQPGDPRPRYRLEPKPLISPVYPHPLVRTHPESGKLVLFLDATTEVEVVGMERQAGAALIERLRTHLSEERFRYTHRWQVGDIVYWDNQATLHARSAFDPAERRVLKRISLAGSRPF